jgi:hypothetical protein
MLSEGRTRESPVPLSRGLSTGPKTEAGRARIAEAQRRRWCLYEKGGRETSLANGSGEGEGVQIEGHRWWRVSSPLIARPRASGALCVSSNAQWRTTPLFDRGESLMALYELRTYTLRVGAMAEAVKLY